MQKTKLTVRVPQELLSILKKYANANNTTMTALIETYLRRIPPQELPADAPIVRRVSGILSQRVSNEDYEEHLAEKFRN